MGDRCFLHFSHLKKQEKNSQHFGIFEIIYIKASILFPYSEAPNELKILFELFYNKSQKCLTNLYVYFLYSKCMDYKWFDFLQNFHIFIGGQLFL